MTIELARRLLGAGAPPAAIEAALMTEATQGAPFILALIERAPSLRVLLERELARADAPEIHWVRATPELVRRLPPGLCQRLLAVPVHRDGATGRVDVAAVDTLGLHVAMEFAFHLDSPVRVLRAELDQIRLALSNIGSREAAAPPPGGYASVIPPASVGRSSRPPPAPSAPPIPLVRRPALRASAVPDFSDPVLALSRSKLPEPVPAFTFELDLDEALLELGRADSAELVARWICRALEPALSLVLALRGASLEPRASSSALVGRGPAAFPADKSSVFEQALRTGFYLGPLPASLPHAALRAALPAGAADEVYCVPVIVSGRPVLLLLMTESGPSLAGTRRADRLASAAGSAIERILLARKRGLGES